MSYEGRWETVRVEVDDGIAWVELHRPEKRNAMNPKLNAEMIEVLEELDADDAAGVLVLTGAGDSFSAGMDLKEYFREVDGAPAHVQRRVRRDNGDWQIRMLRSYAKPTIAMVNGWCFGGAFIPLVGCDLAVAADEATFGVSEINWGIPPGSVVSRALAETVGSRHALLYIMTGRTFDGRRAAEIGLVNWSTPRGVCAARSRRSRASCWRRTRSRCAPPSSGSATAAGEVGASPRTTCMRSSSSRSSSTPRAAAPRDCASSSTRSGSGPASTPTCGRDRCRARRRAASRRGLMQDVPLTLELVMRRIETVAAPLPVVVGDADGRCRHTLGRDRVAQPAADERARRARAAGRRAHRDARLERPPPPRAVLRGALRRSRAAHAERARRGRPHRRADRSLPRRGAVPRRLADGAGGRASRAPAGGGRRDGRRREVDAAFAAAPRYEALVEAAEPARELGPMRERQALCIATRAARPGRRGPSSTRTARSCCTRSGRCRSTITRSAAARWCCR